MEEATDDMRSLFYDDPLAISMIAEMEKFVELKYNHMVDSVERFFERNKHLDRKEYAILGQHELDKMFFGLAMSKYLGKTVDYKAFLKGQWKKLGLKDVEEIEDWYMTTKLTYNEKRLLIRVIRCVACGLIIIFGLYFTGIIGAWLWKIWHI